MKKRVLSLALMMSVGISSAFSQDGTKMIKGTIYDDSGAPAAGAAVETEDGNISTFTDDNGNFELEVPSNSSNTVIVSYGDYKTKSVTATSEGVIEYKLIEKGGVQTLDEQIVIGRYINISKEKWTGAGDVFGQEKIEKFPVTDITRAIEGSAPGVQVTNGGGQPGTGAGVQIRGRSSLSAGGGALYVVDGAPYQGDITAINPSDIESVALLKDATATSLFGSLGANGVIVITTKKGRHKNGARINFESKFGVVGRALEDYETISDAGQYYQVLSDGLVNFFVNENGMTLAAARTTVSDNLINYIGGWNPYDVPNNQIIDPVTGLLNPNLGSPRYQDSWKDELQQRGLRSDYSLSVDGATDNTNYYFSLGYLKEQGYIKRTDYERLSTRMNVNTRVNSWLRAGLNMSLSYQNMNVTPNGDDGGLAPGNNPFLVDRLYPVIYPIFYRNAQGEKEIDPITGTWKYEMGDPSVYPDHSAGQLLIPGANVLAAVMLDKNNTKSFNLTAIPYVEVEFMKNFTFRTEVNTNLYNSNSLSYANKYFGESSKRGGYVGIGNGNTWGYTWFQTLNWRKTFDDKHSLDLLGSHESYLSNGNSMSASRYGVPNHNHPNLAGAAVSVGSSSSESFHRREGYLVRGLYDYENTYFLSGSYRLDATSRLSPESRWGGFWSLGGAYNIKKADFLKDVTAINSMKLKASYGTTGNENFNSLYMYQRFYNFTMPNGNATGALSSGLGNPDLVWEKVGMFNGGVEFGLYDYRVSGEVNYYVKTTKDMFFNLPTAPSIGVGSKPVNIGDLQTKGIEATLNFGIIRNGKEGFNWDMQLIASRNRNVITKMPTGMDTLISGARLLKVGHSIDEFWMLESAGVDRETGSALWYYYDGDGNKAATDDYNLAMTNGRGYRGTSQRDLEGAITNTFTYKNLGLSFMVSYGVGGKYYDELYTWLMESYNLGLNYHVDMLDRWTPENKDATIPRNQYNDGYQAGTSDRFLIDASFLNIRNINLYYDFPERITSKLKMSGIKIFASADNVWMFSARKGMDPQGSIGNVPGWNYPVSRVISAGFRITL